MTTTLVIIDLQRVYFESPVLKARQAELVAVCNELTAAFRARNRPVIWVRTMHQTTGETWTLSMQDDHQGYLFEGSLDVQFVAGLTVEPHDLQLTKVRDSAFYATILDQVLRQYHTNTIVLAGVSTHTCVGQTAADAYARNIRVLLAHDAIATHEERFHAPTLKRLEIEYRQPAVSVRQLTEWLA